MKNNFWDTKKDFIAIAILLAVFFILLYSCWGKWGDMFMDCARELYLPQLVMQGNVLFKDVLCLYGPFSYQLNALLYQCFGVSITTLQVAGTVNALIIILTAYLVCRTVSSVFTSFACVFTVMTVLVFRVQGHTISNIFFSYSYAWVYAFSAMFLSLLFTLYYFKFRKVKLLYPAFFFMGLSIASKYDFILYLLVLLLILALDKLPSVKQKFIAGGLLLLPPLACWGVLFAQGLTFEHIAGHIQFWQNFQVSPTIYIFNKHWTGLYLSADALRQAVFSFFVFWAYYIRYIAVAGVFVFLFNRFKARKDVCVLIALLSYWPMKKLIIATQFQMALAPDLGYHRDFNWLTYAVVVIIILVMRQKKLSLRRPFQKKYLKHWSFALIAASALMSCVRTPFGIHLENQGLLNAFLLFIPVIIYFMDYLPGELKRVNKTTWQRVGAVSLLFLSLTYLYISMMCVEKLFCYKLKNIKGTWYTLRDYGHIMDLMADYVNANLKEGETILMAPEGPLLAFMTGAPSSKKYYSIIPHIVDSYGEENVVAGLSQEKPTYIFLTNLSCDPFKNDYVGKEYMFLVKKFIDDNYEYVGTFPELAGYEYKTYLARSNNFNIKLYKYKNSK